MAAKGRRVVERSAVQAILALSSILLMLRIAHAQSTPVPIMPGGWTPQQLQQIGLVGCLMLTVVVLWKTLQVERAAAALALKTSTEVLTKVTLADEELRSIVEDSVTAKRELAEEIRLLRNALGALPCTRDAPLPATHPAYLGGRVD